MIKWEYMMRSDSTEGFDLDTLGEDGWELVSVVPETHSNIIFGGSDTVRITYIFKRPKQNEDNKS